MEIDGMIQSARKLGDPSGSAAFIFCALLLLAPLFFFRYFPNQDGPAHVSSAIAILKLRDATSFLHGYFLDSGDSITNWVTAFVFQHMPGFIPVDRYEAAFAAIYLVTLFGAVVFTLRSILKIEASAGVVFLPFAYTHMLHMGSFNLSIAVPPFIVLLGACHAYLVRPTLWKALGIAVLSITIYVVHVQVSLVALACVGLYSLCALVVKVDAEAGASHLLGHRFVKAATLAAAGFPLFAACLAFALLDKAGGLPSHPEYPGLLARALHLALLSGVASYSVFGLGVTLLLALGLVLLIAIGLRQIVRTGLQSADCLLFCAAVLLAVFLFLPNGYTDTYNVEERLMPPLLAILATWIVLRVYPIVPKRATLTIVSGLMVLQTIDRAAAFHETDLVLSDYASISAAVPDNVALVVINFDRIEPQSLKRSIAHPFAPALRFDPYRVFIGTALGDRNVAMLSNYQAQGVRPYFALKYRSRFASIITGLEPAPPEALEFESGALTEFLRRLRDETPPVSYAVVWRADLEESSSPRIVAATSALHKACDRVAISASGRVELCRIRNP